MNQTKQEAAARYVFDSKHTGGQRIIEIETAAFMAGADWAELKWIPVTERLPEIGQPVIVRCVKVELYYDMVYFDGSFSTKHITHWCAIPDSLLNFKP
jgi:hypothetical protein